MHADLVYLHHHPHNHTGEKKGKTEECSAMRKTEGSSTFPLDVSPSLYTYMDLCIPVSEYGRLETYRYLALQ